MNCYNIVRFNGSVQDCVMKSHLDYESAKKISEYLNGINKKLEISYRVVEYRGFVYKIASSKFIHPNDGSK